MTNRKTKTKANSGQARILEAVIAALIIFIVFTASAFFINSSRTTTVQERADLDRLGYNVLSKIIESGTIEATIDQPTLLKAFLQNSLPSSILFKLTLTTWKDSNGWVTATTLPPLSNSDDNSFSNSAEVSSTPMMYTSKGGNIYYLVLVLANAGQGT
jgi:hypothetical protein